MQPAERLAPEADLHAGVLVARVAARLADAGSATARLDAELLVGHAFGRDRAWLHAHPDVALDRGSRADLEGWVERRAAGEPVAYIRGYKEWFGTRVATDPRALIPRPETELLAESAIAEVAARLVRDDRTVLAWDVATGGGAVALALAIRFRTAISLGRVRLVASDVSADALELASENLAAHRVESLATLILGDLLDGGDHLNEPAMLDVVTANLPYVTSAEVDLGAGSHAFEPRLALDGGTDGLDLVRRLIAQLPDRLAPGGVAMLEVGAGQANAVGEMAAALRPPIAVTLLPDLSGIERVVRIARLD